MCKSQCFDFVESYITLYERPRVIDAEEVTPVYEMVCATHVAKVIVQTRWHVGRHVAVEQVRTVEECVLPLQVQIEVTRSPPIDGGGLFEDGQPVLVDGQVLRSGEVSVRVEQVGRGRTVGRG